MCQIVARTFLRNRSGTGRVPGVADILDTEGKALEIGTADPEAGGGYPHERSSIKLFAVRSEASSLSRGGPTSTISQGKISSA